MEIRQHLPSERRIVDSKIEKDTRGDHGGRRQRESRVRRAAFVALVNTAVAKLIAF